MSHRNVLFDEKKQRIDSEKELLRLRQSILERKSDEIVQTEVDNSARRSEISKERVQLSQLKVKQFQNKEDLRLLESTRREIMKDISHEAKLSQIKQTTRKTIKSIADTEARVKKVKQQIDKLIAKRACKIASDSEDSESTGGSHHKKQKKKNRSPTRTSGKQARTETPSVGPSDSYVTPKPSTKRTSKIASDSEDSESTGGSHHKKQKKKNRSPDSSFEDAPQEVSILDIGFHPIYEPYLNSADTNQREKAQLAKETREELEETWDPELADPHATTPRRSTQNGRSIGSKIHQNIY